MAEVETESSSAVADNQKLPQALRDDLVSTAVKFLQNPRVATRPNSEKELFLQRKGLTQAEISAAFEASGINRLTDNGTVGHYSSVKVAELREYSNRQHQLVPRSRWAIIRDILNAAALGAGILYCLRYLYRRFIAPWLFGRQKAKTIEERVDEMNSNLTRMVSEVTVAVQNLTVTVSTLRANQKEKSEMKDLKSEVASLKALLLGRRQFPAPPSIVTGPPSIPAWQLGASSEGDKMDARSNPNGHQLLGHGDGISLSSSPEIISVDEMPSNSLPNPGESNSGSSGRDPSESSETNSAEMVEMGASASGGSGEDTD